MVCAIKFTQLQDKDISNIKIKYTANIIYNVTTKFHNGTSNTLEYLTLTESTFLYSRLTQKC